MKIAESIYTPFQKVPFLTVLPVSCNFRNIFLKGKQLKSAK